MKIKRIEIGGFGKLHNFVFEPNDEFNLIFGANESGKSTLQNFIRAMFYGIDELSVRKGEMRPYERFRPWGDYPFEGSIEYELDNKDRYKVYRQFEEDTIYVFDSEGRDITRKFKSKENKNLFAHEHLGMSLNVFEKTAFIEQAKIKFDKIGNVDLKNRLLNVYNSGFENISVKKIIDKLNKRRMNYSTDIGDKSKLVASVDREIDMLKNQILKEKKERERIFNANDSLKKLFLKKQNMEEKVNKLNLYKRLEIITKRLKIVKRSYKELEVEIEAKRKIEAKINDLKTKEIEIVEKEDDIKELIELKSEKLNYSDRKSKLILPFGISMAFAIIIAVVSLVLENMNLLYYAAPFLGISLILLIIEFIQILKKSFQENKINKKIGNLLKLNLLPSKTSLNELLVIQKKIEEEKERKNKIEQLKEERMDRIENINEKYASIKLTSEEDINTIADAKDYIYKTEEEIENIRNFIENKKDDEEQVYEELDNIKAEIVRNEVVINQANKNPDNLQRLYEELSILNEKKLEIENTEKSLDISIKYLREASKEIRNNYSPKLNEEISKIIGSITKSRYQKINSDDELDLKPLSEEAGKEIDVMSLSTGTIEQMYLAMRLASVFIMSNSNERLPIFMDEIFAYADERRTIEALRLLKKEKKNFQMFLITCKKTEASIVKTLFDDDILIKQLKV